MAGRPTPPRPWTNGEDLAQRFLKKALENSDCSITGSDDDKDDEDA